jgi:hypothetical protein
LAGFGQNRPALSINDELYASAVAIRRGGVTGVLVSLDAVGLMAPDIDLIRMALRRMLPISFVIVASTHTHAAPDVIGIWGPNVLTSGADDVYIEHLRTRAIEAGRQAFANLEPVRVLGMRVERAAASAVADTRQPFVFDPDAFVLRFLNKADGRTLGAIVNWSNHPEVLWDRNTAVTADYVHYLREGLERGLIQNGETQRAGFGGQVVYFSGAVGGLLATTNATAVQDPMTGEIHVEPSFAKARSVGYLLAQSILDGVDRGQELPVPTTGLRWTERSLKLPIDNLKFLAAGLIGIIRRSFDRDFATDSSVGLLEMGDVWLATVPGELYPELANGGVEAPSGNDFGLSAPSEQPPLRSRMRGRLNMVVGLANDQIGYIVPTSQWDEKQPFTYGLTSAPYGEENSLGWRTAAIVHNALLELFAQSGSGREP